MYKHILVATNLTPEADQIGQKALEAAKKWNAKLSLVHVVDYSPMMYGGGEFALPIDAELEQNLTAEAKTNVNQQGKKLGVKEADQWIVKGHTKDEIVDLAEKLKADLIIVGSHDKHGLALLFGSTANAILHAMPCDVLAVKLSDE